MTTYDNKPEVTTCQRSESDAARPSSTKIEIESSTCSQEEVIKGLLAILAAISSEALSADQWSLAFNHARLIATERYGLNAEQWSRVQSKLATAIEANRQRNPLVRSGFI